MENITRPQKFTEYFGLTVEQDEIEFLDIYAERDILLFLDPYGISSIGNAWAKECENQIAAYFQILVDSIKTKDKKAIKSLLSALHEVKEIGLGYSTNSSDGRGIGSVQAEEILQAFQSSEAAKSGDINDIADCALLIPGINRDKISDMTANILKKQLIQFTKAQCDLYSIPMKRVPIYAFDFESISFKSYFDTLPVINGSPKILLPISSVRHDPDLGKDRYYRNFVLEFLKAEHSHAGDSLSSVLKNGEVRVYIKDLKKKYPLGVKFLYQFSKDHPKILQNYKEQLRQKNTKNRRPKLKIEKKKLQLLERISLLEKIKSGNENATQFHNLSFNNFQYIFGERFSNPKVEQRIDGGRKRVDIVFDNDDNKGFFHKLNTVNKVHCPKIFIECKNYGKEIGNPELDQLLGRFSKRRGVFGILLCREIKDSKTMILRCRDAVNNNDNYIIVLDDRDVKQLINLKDNRKEREIDKFMSEKFDQLIM